jgi:hypothetical protein
MRPAERDKAIEPQLLSQQREKPLSLFPDKVDA